MFKWLFTKEHHERKKAQSKTGTGEASSLSFWGKLLNSLTYSVNNGQRRAGDKSYTKQSSTGNNSGNYNYSTQSKSKAYTHSINNVGSGKEEFIVNGKKLVPGTPEYIAAQKALDSGMRTFQAGMETFEESMNDFAKDMKDMFK